jgi:pimeloyl-ACP methyl ester carboxylesterase
MQRHHSRRTGRTAGRTLILSLVAVAALVLAACRPVGVPGGGGGGGGGGPQGPKPTIVLVHGAFADASGWDGVAKRLQRAGYEVLAPANPLRGLGSDAAYIRSILDTITGPIVLVGHSYGGMVMTNAAAGDADVKALVYIASFAPDVGDSVGSLSALNPGSGVVQENLVIRPTPTGLDGYINPTVFRDVFAGDLPRQTTAAMAASQRPADLGLLTEASGAPAWATIPSWYLVATQDKVIPPATQRFMAKRAHATTIEIRSSHVAMTSHPDESTLPIVAAVRAVS